MFKVWEPKEKEAPKKELYLKLVQDGADVNLTVVGEDGTPAAWGNVLLWVTPDGKIHIAKNVDKDLGFKLDEKAHVKLVMA